MKPLAMTENSVEALRLLVVSKEAGVVRSLAQLGESGRWQVEVASNGWDAMERLESDEAPQLLLLDLPRGDGDSFPMLRWLRRLNPELPVIAICDADDHRLRQEAMRLGTEKILARPLDLEQLEFQLRRYRMAGVADDLDLLAHGSEPLDADGFFVSASAIMKKVRAQAELLAQTDVPVFIAGESGSGRDALARLMHRLSVRSGFRFRKINCAAPDDLLEHDLFGAEGVFGSAARVSASGLLAGAGKLEAERGTIFLDEIAEMPSRLQARLYQALCDYYPRSGQLDPRRPAEVRILSASSDVPEKAVEEGKLREDLYHQVSAFTVQLPSLRQRKEEIPVLLRCFMRRLAKHYGMTVREFSPAALEACRRYSWPGNLTELETFVKRYLVAGEAQLVSLRADATGEANVDTNGDSSGDAGRENAATSGALSFLANPFAPNSAPEAADQDVSAKAPKSLKSLIQDIKSEAERTAIAAALEKTGWNRKAAARLLRVSYRTLLYKIEQYQMKASQPWAAESMESLALEGKRNGRAS